MHWLHGTPCPNHPELNGERYDSGACKACVIERSAQRYVEKAEEIKAYKREYRQRPEVKERDKEAARARQERSVRHRVMKGLKKRAKDLAVRGLTVEVQYEYLMALFERQQRRCTYTGVELAFTPVKTASLDRIDSSKGYVEGNVQWVHKHINIAKGTLCHDEFIIMCMAVAREHASAYGAVLQDL